METPPSAPHPSDGGRPLVEDPATVAELRSALLAFYDARARDLPWRRTDDPYAIWVSEVMLQQTRVETVVPYYRAWMERFPTVEALARAEQEEVLKAWEGLGYYRRARMLHRAAAVVRDRMSGILPDTVDGLRELPGIGEYTAGAVASIAFGRRAAAVDGNVRRVLARLLDLPEPTAARLRNAAAALVDPARPGDFNQALMELGATLCTPRDPECGACPWAQRCLARAAGVQEERPLPKRRAAVPERVFGVAVVRRGRSDGGATEILLVRRPEEGLLGGMWELPGSRLREGEEPEEGALRAATAAAGAPPVRDGEELPPVSHTYSHFRGVYRAVPFRSAASSSDGAPGDGAPGDGAPGDAARWVATDGLEGLPLPVAQRRILAMVVDPS